jgi:hypothetical protein
MIAFKLLQMMGDRSLMGICGGNRLWDERRGLFDGFHASTRHDRSSNVNVFKASSLTDLKPALEQKLSKMMENRCPRGMFG